MQAISITGFKNSGKTTLTLLLAQALERRGLRVAVAKRSHHPLDKPHTDTGALRAPGRTVLGITEEETAIFWGEERPLPDMLPLLHADILLLEGGKNRTWLPRILCLRNPAEADALNSGLALASFGPVAAPGLPHFTAGTPDSIDALAELASRKAFALPGLDCGACGRENCLGLAQAIVRGEASVDDCAAQGGEVQVRIDGSPLPLNPFTARVLGGAVRGMLQEMKGIAPGKVVLEMTMK